MVKSLVPAQRVLFTKNHFLLVVKSQKKGVKSILDQFKHTFHIFFGFLPRVKSEHFVKSTLIIVLVPGFLP